MKIQEELNIRQSRRTWPTRKPVDQSRRSDAEFLDYQKSSKFFLRKYISQNELQITRYQSFQLYIQILFFLYTLVLVLLSC